MALKDFPAGWSPQITLALARKSGVVAVAGFGGNHPGNHFFLFHDFDFLAGGDPPQDFCPLL